MTTQARELAKLVNNAGDVNLIDDITLGSDGALLNFGADSDVVITHVADTGLLLNSTRQLQFGDSGTYIHQSADGVLDLVSDTEIELNATTLDINANVDISGTLTVAGALDFGDAVLSNVGAVALDSISGDADANTSITFSGSDVITITTGGETQVTFNNGSILPTTDNDIDLGSSSLQFKNAHFHGTVETDALTIGGTTLAETIADTVGAMVSSNTETNITVSYDDSDNTLDFVVGTLNQNTSGSAVSLANARTIHGVSFNGTADIDLSEPIQDTVGAMFSSNTETGITATYQDGDGTIDLVVGTLNQNTTGTAATVTTAAQTNITSLGTLTTLTVDEMTLNTDTLTATDTFTIDAVGDITLDADGGDIRLKDAGTQIGQLHFGSSNLSIYSSVQDKDIVFLGNDGGSEVTALTLDMSAAGAATFNGTVVSPLVDAAIVDGENFKINGAQGSDGQVLTSTGSGVAWEAAGGGGGATFKTFGTGSIMVGDDATGTINAADNNTGLGVDVFAALTSGDGNTAVGNIALDAITTSSDNTAVGHQSLTNATSGVGNTALGKGTMTAVVTGSNNVAVGRYALSANTSASNNVAIGINSLVANNTGASNTAVGGETLAANTSGTNNVAIGTNALFVNTTGSYNIAIGNIALDANTSGNYNTAIGRNCLTKNTTGHDNVGLGINVLAENTTGHYNVAIGSSAMNGCAGGEYNTAVGDKALDAGSMTGNFNVAVGTGALGVATSASSNTCLGLSAGASTTTSNNNCFMGESTGFANTTGMDNTFIGHYAGYAGGVQMTTGSHNTYIGKAASGSAVGNIAEIVLGYNVLGAGSKTFTVGVTYSSVYRRTLDLTSSATTFTNPSDLRLKENITDSSVGLNFINDLRPITYTWKAKKDVPTDMSQYEENSIVPCSGSGKTNYGFVAQEVKSTIDNYNVADGQAIHSVDPDGTQHLSPAELVPMLVKALQEADNKIEALVARVTTLEG